jgi:hypothetical protein
VAASRAQEEMKLSTNPASRRNNRGQSATHTRGNYHRSSSGRSSEHLSFNSPFLPRSRTHYLQAVSYHNQF